VSFLIDAKFGGQIFSGTNAGAVGRNVQNDIVKMG
jgi:hypothetical protein